MLPPGRCYDSTETPNLEVDGAAGYCNTEGAIKSDRHIAFYRHHETTGAILRALGPYDTCPNSHMKSVSYLKSSILICIYIQLSRIHNSIGRDIFTYLSKDQEYRKMTQLKEIEWKVLNIGNKL